MWFCIMSQKTGILFEFYFWALFQNISGLLFLYMHKAGLVLRDLFWHNFALMQLEN